MSTMTEVIWHGRGGQGAKTAATMLAAMAIHEGKFSQGAPEYGPERQGAPMKGYTRIDARPIRIHSAIQNGDVSVVLDPTLVRSVDILGQMKHDGILIVNTTKSPDELRAEMKAPDTLKIYTVDATGIALKEIGRDLPNTPLLAALIRVTAILELETVLHDMREKFEKKFSAKVVEGNIRAVKRAYEEVR